MSESRASILGRLKDAGTPPPEIGVETAYVLADLWSDFEARLVELGGRLIGEEELQATLAKPCFIEEAAAKILGLKHKNEKDIWDIEVGVSVADLAIAETGSLVVSAGLAKRRMSSLVPPVNVVLASRKSIVGKLADALPLIGSRTSAIITGPSRTADIEGILVRGVHGPGELLVYVYD